MEGKFNIDGLKGIFTSQPTGIPDRKMGNARSRHKPTATTIPPQ
jgi:hypothetical protein